MLIVIVIVMVIVIIIVMVIVIIIISTIMDSVSLILHVVTIKDGERGEGFVSVSQSVQCGFSIQDLVVPFGHVRVGAATDNRGIAEHWIVTNLLFMKRKHSLHV
eukprot:1714599-Karenia_brevis.AAC.1